MIVGCAASVQGRPRLFVNAVSSRVGGGLNDLVHTIPLLDERLTAQGWDIRLWVGDEGWHALNGVGFPMQQVQRVRLDGPLQRAFWEFVRFPSLVRAGRAERILQFSNFAVARLPVPQVVVLRSPTFFAQEYAGLARRGWYQGFRYYAGRWLSRRTIRISATVFCISRTHKGQVTDACGKLADAVRVSHLGVSGPGVVPRSGCGAGLDDRQQQQMAALSAPEQRIILNISSYYEHKNLLTLLRAMRGLSRNYADLRLVMTAGILDYSGADTGVTRQERALARELAAEGVLFDLGPVPKAAVWYLLERCAVFAFPSTVESFGHPLLEAMIMARPVVASDTPIHREICGPAALFHPVFDAGQLAQRLEQVLAGDGVRRKLVEEGRRVVERFTWERHADDLAAAIMAAGVERDQHG